MGYNHNNKWAPTSKLKPNPKPPLHSGFHFRYTIPPKSAPPSVPPLQSPDTTTQQEQWWARHPQVPPWAMNRPLPTSQMEPCCRPLPDHHCHSWAGADLHWPSSWSQGGESCASHCARAYEDEGSRRQGHATHWFSSCFSILPHGPSSFPPLFWLGISNALTPTSALSPRRCLKIHALG